AWQVLKKEKALCAECDARHPFDIRKAKSRIPHSIRRSLSPLADAALPWLKSEAAGRAAGPHVRRDWSREKAGNVFVADDVTFNLNVWWLAEGGSPDWGRVEVLYMAGELTSKPLA